VWFVKLGIRPERIEKGHPEQNGRHERMHRTLKEETIRPPRKSIGEQQRAFDHFRPVFNYDRPHEALGQKPPASAYQRSTREYPAKPPEIEYSPTFEVRKVQNGGCFKWRDKEFYLSGALGGERIGLKQINDNSWKIYFSFYPVAILDERLLNIVPC